MIEFSYLYTGYLKYDEEWNNVYRLKCDYAYGVTAEEFAMNQDKIFEQLTERIELTGETGSAVVDYGVGISSFIDDEGLLWILEL